MRRICGAGRAGRRARARARRRGAGDAWACARAVSSAARTAARSRSRSTTTAPGVARALARLRALRRARRERRAPRDDRLPRRRPGPGGHAAGAARSRTGRCARCAAGYDLVVRRPARHRQSRRAEVLDGAEGRRSPSRPTRRPSASRPRCPSAPTELGDDPPLLLDLPDRAGPRDLRTSLRVEKIIPLGVSYGGQVAGEYARRFPGRTQALILDSTGADRGRRRARPAAVARAAARPARDVLPARLRDAARRPGRAARRRGRAARHARAAARPRRARRAAGARTAHDRRSPTSTRSIRRQRHRPGAAHGAAGRARGRRAR